jgi:hypothetical protein
MPLLRKEGPLRWIVIGVLGVLALSLLLGGIAVLANYKDYTPRVLTYYAVKVMLTALLVWLVVLSAGEIYRLWFVRRITLNSFDYVKDGTETKDAGDLFARQVNQDLELVRQLLKGEAKAQLPTEPGRVVPATIGALALEPGMLRGVELPVLASTPLSQIDVTVQGVNLSSLLNSIMKFVHPPDEISGRVSERNRRFTIQVELHRALKRRGGDPPLQVAPDHDSMEQASLATACRILYLLAADEEPALLSVFQAVELELYVRALQQFGLFTTYNMEFRADGEKATKALNEADRLITGLITDGTKLDAAYKLGALIAFAKKDAQRARSNLEEYVKRVREARQGQPDDAAERLLAYVNPPPSMQVQGVAGPVVALTQRVKRHVVQPGLSVSSEKASAGTICALVRDRDDKTKQYLLSADQVFAGDPDQTPVFQPALLDGADTSKDKVAVVSQRRIKLQRDGPQSAAGALAEIVASVQGDPTCYGLGKFMGIAEVKQGDQVRLMGRTSGLVAGQVTAVGRTATVALPDPTGPVTFSGLIVCQGAAGGAFAKPGDSGAPVVNAGNKLIGMLYAGSTSESFVIPIGPILETLKVELITE